MVVVLEPGLPPGLEEVRRRGHVSRSDGLGCVKWLGLSNAKWLPSGSVNDEGDATALRPGAPMQPSIVTCQN